jgi:hypothetical protein
LVSINRDGQPGVLGFWMLAKRCHGLPPCWVSGDVFSGNCWARAVVARRPCWR